MLAVAEDTIEHIVVACINAGGLIVVAVISYMSGRRHERRDTENSHAEVTAPKDRSRA